MMLCLKNILLPGKRRSENYGHWSQTILNLLTCVHLYLVHAHRASFDLSMTDISEIARNSVLQSGFEEHLKREWLGEDFKRGITFCDEVKTHVPLIRAKFRAEHLALEHMLVNLIGAGKGDAVLKEMMVHFGLARDAHRNILVNNLPDVPAFPEQNQL